MHYKNPRRASKKELRNETDSLSDNKLDPSLTPLSSQLAREVKALKDLSATSDSSGKNRRGCPSFLLKKEILPSLRQPVLPNFPGDLPPIPLTTLKRVWARAHHLIDSDAHPDLPAWTPSRYKNSALMTRLWEVGNFDSGVIPTAFIILERALSEAFSKKYGKMATWVLALFVAQKYVCDEQIWFLNDFCQIADINRKFLEQAERLFLESLGFKLYVSRKELDFACDELPGNELSSSE